MRPTSLGFRNPKERTPGSYFPNLTYDGNRLSFNTAKSKTKRFNFSTSPRFPRPNFCPTGFQVGPGSYSPERYTERVPGTPMYKKPHREIGSIGYMYVDEHLVHDPALEPKSTRRLSMDPRRRSDNSYALQRVIKKIRDGSSPIVRKSARKRGRRNRTDARCGLFYANAIPKHYN